MKKKTREISSRQWAVLFRPLSYFILHISYFVNSGQQLPNPLDRLLDILHRICIGEAHVAFAILAECRTGKACNPALVQEPRGQRARVDAGACGIREHIERAEWLVALEAGYRVHAIDDDIAAAAEFLDNVIHPCLRSGQRLDPCDLDEARRAARNVRLKLRDDLCEMLRHDAIPQAPAGHRIRLRKSIEDD